jgi:hypothetical protein
VERRRVVDGVEDAASARDDDRASGLPLHWTREELYVPPIAMRAYAGGELRRGKMRLGGEKIGRAGNGLRSPQ